MTPTLLSRVNGRAWNPTLLSNFLLALQRDPSPPVMFGPHRLERVRIVIIERDDPGLGEADIDVDDLDDDEDDDAPEVLPPLPRNRLPMPPRVVHGEILRGEDGALFERFGNRIRPLHRLASGPRGEVLEVPGAGPAPASRAPAAAPVEPAALATETQGPVEPVAPEPRAATTPTPPPVAAAPLPTPPFRALFAEPGQWRVLRYGDMPPLIARQLVHPERLREQHRLPCYVQVYEAAMAQPLTALALAVLGDPARADELVPLHPALLAPLMLAGVLPPPRPSRRTAQHDPAWLLPGERCVRITLAHDPTAHTTPPAAPVEKTATVAVPTPAVPVLKDAVPETFLRAAPFAVSREEALLTLTRAEGLGSRLRRFVRGATSPADLRTWQVRLSGRGIDEQLWAVPPPRGWRHAPAVRAWAEQSLALGGYVLPAMLREWELFWVRQGR